MIKYIGSKRRLVPAIASLARPALAPPSARSGAADGRPRALDLFTGTTRVAQALKTEGAHVTAVDSATYSHVLAETYVATDAGKVALPALALALQELSMLPPAPGYVTEVFCKEARYFHPDNGARIDAVRQGIEAYAASPLYPLLLASLLEAADRVDSTTGLQMAFLKQWAPRALRPLELRVPTLLVGDGRAVRNDAQAAIDAGLGSFAFAYLDPPYNQHRYFTNYHVWETLVRWDAPPYYGVACKRLDCRDEASQSPFNRRSTIAGALARAISGIDSELMVVSYNDEAWLSLDDLVAMCEPRGDVRVLSFESRRYVGAKIGIHNLSGVKVGQVSHLHNTEIMVVSGPARLVQASVEACEGVDSAS